MKKTFLLLLSVIISVNMAFGQDVSQKEASHIIEKYYGTDDYSVFVSKDIVRKNTPILCSDTVLSPNFDSWLFFIDEKPGENWEHPCKLIFVNSVDGEYVIVNEKFPPNISDLLPIKQKSFNIKISKSDYFNVDDYKSNIQRNGNSYITDNKYAIIISGGGNVNSNYERYWNDCSAIFKTLKDIYGYKQSNIKVIISDGTNPADDRCNILQGYKRDSSPLDLNGDGINDTQYAATKQNVSNVIAQTLNSMNADDELFIFVTDHGGIMGGEAVIYLWNNEYLKASELRKIIDDNCKIDRRKKAVHMVMGQCNSGGFSNAFKSSLYGSIAAACSVSEVSYAMSNLLYDEFLYHWISAMAKKTILNNSTINADTDNSGLVTYKEAFVYANANDKWSETPQYYAYRDSFGDYYGLAELPAPPRPPRPHRTSSVTIDMKEFSYNQFQLSTTQQEEISSRTMDETYAYSLHDITNGVLIKQGRVKLKGGILNFSDCRKGIYVLNISLPDAVNSRKITIK